MMTEEPTGICIGGPLDGQIMRIKHGETFQVSAEPPMSIDRFRELADAPTTFVAKRVTYERCYLAGDATKFLAWRLEGLGYDEVVRRLLSRYAEAA